MYDVFVSYRHSDAEAVRPLVSALERLGLTVWFDASSVPDFGSISEAARRGLAESKALVVYYSAGFPQSSPCQWELTQGFVASMRLGDPSKRVLVVNPEPGSLHIEPVELRDALYGALAGVGTGTTEVDEIAARIASHVATIDEHLGEGMAQPATWLPSHPSAATRFAGRFRQMWQIHSAIHAPRLAMTQGAVGPGICQVRGLGGVGKSLLTREYALRYQASFPGGVFWLYAQGDVTSIDGPEREALRLNQIRGFAHSVLEPELASGIDALAPLDLEAVLRNALGRKTEPYLWVVDDLPGGLASDEVYRWVGPPGACTIVTTRSSEYGALMPEVNLGVLEPDEALQVLVARRPPKDEAELEAARQIVAELGGHALAIDVAGATLRFQSFTELFAHLLDPTQDELELAAALKEELPTGRERSISATLSLSVDRLGDGGRDLLRIASMLAQDPIPRSLIDATLQATDSLDPTPARIATMTALDELLSLSLIEPVEDGSWQIHPLLARTVVLKDTDPDRRAALRHGAVAALTRLFEDPADPQSRETMRPLVAHARRLVQHLTDLGDTELASQVAAYDLQVGDYSSAKATQRAEVAALAELLGEHERQTLAAKARLAATLRMVFELPESRQMFEAVLQADREVFGPDDRDTLMAAGELSRTLILMEEPETAKSLAEEALSGRRRILGPEHPETLRAASDLANALDFLGDSQQAKTLIDDAVDSYRRVLGSEHPETLKAMTLQVVITASAGDQESARRIGEELLSTRRQVLGDRHPETLVAMNNLAYLLWELGELDDARLLVEQAIESQQELFGKENLSTLCSTDTLACIRRDQGELDAARAMGEEIVATSRRVVGLRNWNTLVFMSNLVQTLRKCGDITAAVDLAEEVVSLSGEALGPDHPMRVAAAEALAALRGG
ncbi:MAG: tetratricopeptide repeat protein [Acidimicrobiales bacterium]